KASAARLTDDEYVPARVDCDCLPVTEAPQLRFINQAGACRIELDNERVKATVCGFRASRNVARTAAIHSNSTRSVTEESIGIGTANLCERRVDQRRIDHQRLLLVVLA